MRSTRYTWVLFAASRHPAIRLILRDKYLESQILVERQPTISDRDDHVVAVALCESDRLSFRKTERPQVTADAVIAANTFYVSCFSRL